MYNLDDIGDKSALLAYLESYLTDKRKKRFEDVLENRTRHFTIAVEDVYKDRNESAIVRTADCFGIQDVHIIENYNKYRLSSGIARGSDKWINIYKYDRDENNTRTCIRELRTKGYRIIATTPHLEDCLLKDFDIIPKTAFLFGGEKEGLSEQAMKDADGFLKIPIVGFTESFNISVAAAIILYNVTQKLRDSNIGWHLCEEEKFNLRLDWTIKTVQNADRLIQGFRKEL